MAYPHGAAICNQLEPLQHRSGGQMPLCEALHAQQSGTVVEHPSPAVAATTLSTDVNIKVPNEHDTFAAAQLCCGAVLHVLFVLLWSAGLQTKLHL